MLQSHLTVTASVTLTKLNRALLTRERRKTTESHHEDRRLLATNCQTHKEGWVSSECFHGCYFYHGQLIRTYKHCFGKFKETSTRLFKTTETRKNVCSRLDSFCCQHHVKIASRGVQNVVGVLKKKTVAAFYSLYLGSGAEKKEMSKFPSSAAALPCFKVLFLCRL